MVGVCRSARPLAAYPGTTEMLTVAVCSVRKKRSLAPAFQTAPASSEINLIYGTSGCGWPKNSRIRFTGMTNRSQ